MHAPLETAELLAFSRTVDAGSLSRAALELGIPRATLGRRLARLEERLGTRLIRRTTRSLSLTDAGEALHAHARIVLDAVSRAEASVIRPDDVPRGALRISAPPTMNAGFHGLMVAFARAHPEVQVEIQFTSRLVDLRREGIDVAIRATGTLEPGLVARTLMRSRLVCVGAPPYLAERGTPRGRRDLQHHRCLMGFLRGELPETHWPARGGGKVPIEGVLFSNDILLLREASKAGLGLALLPDILVRPDLDDGTLVHVLPGVIDAETRMAVVYPEAQHLPPQVRAFVDAVIAWARTELPRQGQDARGAAALDSAPRPALSRTPRRGTRTAPR